jgi:hypothetical protein
MAAGNDNALFVFGKASWKYSKKTPVITLGSWMPISRLKASKN